MHKYLPKQSKLGITKWAVDFYVVYIPCERHNPADENPNRSSGNVCSPDLESLLNYGKSCLLEFEVKKTQALTVSRKPDPDKNPPLVMDGTPIAERKTLKILGCMIDSKGLWSAHIEPSCIQS